MELGKNADIVKTHSENLILNNPKPNQFININNGNLNRDLAPNKCGISGPQETRYRTQEYSRPRIEKNQQRRNNLQRNNREIIETI